VKESFTATHVAAAFVLCCCSFGSSDGMATAVVRQLDCVQYAQKKKNHLAAFEMK